MSSIKYVQSAVQNVHEYLAALPCEQKTLKNVPTPFAGGCELELDDSPELDPGMAKLYQSQIGIWCWCVDLGRIVISTEVSILSTYLFMPHEGHL
jgi:hypothetical protein